MVLRDLLYYILFINKRSIFNVEGMHFTSLQWQGLIKNLLSWISCRVSPCFQRITTHMLLFHLSQVQIPPVLWSSYSRKNTLQAYSQDKLQKSMFTCCCFIHYFFFHFRFNYSFKSLKFRWIWFWSSKFF